MDNRQIVRSVEGFREARNEWITQAIERDSVTAAQHILTCNAKIELLLGMWNWHDESIEFP